MVLESTVTSTHKRWSNVIVGISQVERGVSFTRINAGEHIQSPIEKGSAHYGSPDKVPEVRLEMINQAGKLKIPFTSGILIGIGENRLERVEALLTAPGIAGKYGHIQEIIQNFKAKPRTPMQFHPEPELEEIPGQLQLLRILFSPEMNIQTPPNLNANVSRES